MIEYSENAKRVYQKLYQNKDEKNLFEVHERVAKAVSTNDEEYYQFKWMLDNKIFRPNSPTFIGAGMKSKNSFDGQLLACFIVGIEDSMDSIIQLWEVASKIYASGAGIGINITNLREKGSPISGGGFSSGPVAYLKVLEVVSQTVRSGGKNRRAANLGVFNYNHPDTLSILDTKLDGKELQAFNISMMADSWYMNSVIKGIKENTDFDVIPISPNKLSNYKEKHKGIKDIWNRVIYNCWATGDPGLAFYDTINKFNPFPSKGPIVSLNACAEIALPEWSSCVLGAINLSSCLDMEGNVYFFNFEKLKEYAKWGTIFLDNLISKTVYIHPNIEKVMKENRSIGLGSMSFADILIKLRIEYGSKQCQDLFSSICKELTKSAIDTSIDLAKERGPIAIPEKDKEHFVNLLNYYTDNDEQTIEKFEKYGIRNCTWTCQQPTGTTALSADCSYSFEPTFGLTWTKQLSESNEMMLYANQDFEKLLDEKYPNAKQKILDFALNNNGSIQKCDLISEEDKKIFKVAHDITPYQKIDVQSAGQRYISLAMSSTCNIPRSATVQDVSDIMIYAYLKNLKGITIYRDQCRSWQPVNFGKKEELKPEEYSRPISRYGITKEIQTPNGAMYVTINYDNEGRIFEVFVKVGKQGTYVNLILDALSRCISKALQNQIAGKETTLETFINTLRGNAEKPFWFKLSEKQENPYQAESDIDALGIIFQKVLEELNFNKNGIQNLIANECNNEQLLDKCPVCSKFTLSHTSGCRSGNCLNPECGFSACG